MMCVMSYVSSVVVVIVMMWIEKGLMFSMK